MSMQIICEEFQNMVLNQTLIVSPLYMNFYQKEIDMEGYDFTEDEIKQVWFHSLLQKRRNPDGKNSNTVTNQDVAPLHSIHENCDYQDGYAIDKIFVTELEGYTYVHLKVEKQSLYKYFDV